MINRSREDELLYVLRKLRELRLWQGSLWAALSDDPAKYCLEQPPLASFASPQTSHLSAQQSSAGSISDAVKRSPVGHLFKFYTLLCEIVSVPRRTPEAWVHVKSVSTASSLASQRSEDRDLNMNGDLEHLDARVLARECLKIVGNEMGLS